MTDVTDKLLIKREIFLIDDDKEELVHGHWLHIYSGLLGITYRQSKSRKER